MSNSFWWANPLPLPNIPYLDLEDHTAWEGAQLLPGEYSYRTGDEQMLKNISPLISPALLKVLCEMGHSDRIVLADANFPAESIGRDSIVIRCDGHGISELLQAILPLFPLDTYVQTPVLLMEVMPGDNVKTPVWDTYRELIGIYDQRGNEAIGCLERFAYYEEAKKAYAIVSTGEKALYANLILQKGVL